MTEKKTYKREVAFATMFFVLCLFIYSIIQHSYDPPGAKHTSDIAKFMFPWATLLLASLFGMDWWAKQGSGAK